VDLHSIRQKLLRKVKRYGAMLNSGVRPVRLRPEKPAITMEKKDRPAVNIILFIITFITATFAGAEVSGDMSAMFLSGLPYSITLLTILLSHEFGHYGAARRFGVDATLPYFIPFPSIIGTMGAVIKTRSPIPDRRALFYIGALGPLPGFIMSCAAVILGIYLSEIKPLPAAGGDILIFGDSLLFAGIVRFFHGTVPAGHDIYLSPFAWAGWVGFLITSLNLMPIGQLDGSHILYALIGRKQVVFGWIALAALVAMSFIWEGWIVWVLLTLLVLMIGHPDVPEGEPLSAGEQALGWFCMAILVMTFVPVPVDFLQATL